VAAGGDPKVGRPGGWGRLFAGWLTAQGKICDPAERQATPKRNRDF